MRRALVNVLAYAMEHDLGSVTNPAIGMGTGHLDAGLGADIFVDVIAEHAASGANAPRRIRVVLYTTVEYEAFLAVFAGDKRFAPQSSTTSTEASR